MDHRERLAGGHRRPAPQHVLQHRHRHLHLGAQQPQGGAPPGQGAAHRRHPVVSSPLRKNLGSKNCELSSEDIRRICDAFLAFEETEQSKIFPNEAFGYWKVTVERPLRVEGVDPERAYTAKEIKTLKDEGKRSETAQPVIKKVHKGAEADPLCGLFPATINEQARHRGVRAGHRPAGYRAGPSHRRWRHRGFPASRGTALTPRRLVRAWSSVKVGYEISFTRHFYKPPALAPAGGDTSGHPDFGAGDGRIAGGDCGGCAGMNLGNLFKNFHLEKVRLNLNATPAWSLISGS